MLKKIKKVNRKIKYLVIHCTATPPMREVTGDDIREWHTAEPPIGRGWSRVGYSDLIHLDGTIENLHEFDHDIYIDSAEITNGAKGFNGYCRHIVYAGGSELHDVKKPMDTRTAYQIETLILYCKLFIRRYPWVEIAGHNQISIKPCPSFDVRQFLITEGISRKNIYQYTQNGS